MKIWVKVNIFLVFINILVTHFTNYNNEQFYELQYNYYFFRVVEATPTDTLTFVKQTLEFEWLFKYLFATVYFITCHSNINNEILKILCWFLLHFVVYVSYLSIVLSTINILIVSLGDLVFITPLYSRLVRRALADTSQTERRSEYSNCAGPEVWGLWGPETDTKTFVCVCYCYNIVLC